MADGVKRKDLNVEALRRALRGEGTLSKNQLARKTGLSFPTISRVVDALVEAKELVECGVDRTTGGRSARLYAENPLFRVALTARLESGTLYWCVEDLVGSRLKEGSCKTGGATVQALDELVTEVQETYHQLGAIAVGLDGAVNKGTVTEAFGHPELKGVDLQRYLQESTGLTTVVENDMSVVAAGYMARCAGDISSVVCLYQGVTCPGAGVVLNGEVWRGATGFAGELSFLPGLEVVLGAFDAALREKALKMYTVLVRTYAVLFNPDRVVLYNNDWLRGMADEIRRQCAADLPAKALPHLELSDGFDADYGQGLSAMAQKLLQMDR